MPEPVERSDLPVGQQQLAEIIAAAIRAAVADEEQCLADEDECFRRHPIHVMASCNGVVEAVYADVEGVAEVAAAAVVAEVARVRAQTWAAARSVVEAIDFGASDALMQAVLRGFRDDVVIRMQVYETACRIEAGEPAESVVAALPDVVGTPTHPEARDAD